MLTSGDNGVQEDVLDFLAKEHIAQIAPPDLLAIVYSLTSLAQESVRLRAVLVLGNTPQVEQARSALLGAAADSRASVRRNAVKSLGKLGEPKVATTLVAALKDNIRNR